MPSSYVLHIQTALPTSCGPEAPWWSSGSVTLIMSPSSSTSWRGVRIPSAVLVFILSFSSLLLTDQVLMHQVLNLSVTSSAQSRINLGQEYSMTISDPGSPRFHCYSGLGQLSGPYLRWFWCRNGSFPEPDQTDLPGFRSDYLTPSQKDDAFLATSFVSAKCISLRERPDVTLKPSSLFSRIPRNSTSHCRNFSKQGERNLSLETAFIFDATGFRL